MKNLLLVLSLFLLIYACGKDSEVKVEVQNPLNSQNVKKIAELESQLSSLNSSLSESGNNNQNLTKQVADLQKQLTSTQSLLETSEQTNTSLESQIDSLNVKVADLGLTVWTSLGIQDGIYSLKDRYYGDLDPHTNDTLLYYTLYNERDKLDPKKSVYGEVKNGVLVRSTKNYEIDIYGGDSNKVFFAKWELNDKTRSIHSRGNTHNLYREKYKNLTDTIYISGPYEITTRSRNISNITGATFNGEVYASTKEVSKGLPLFVSLIVSFNNLIGLISILFNFLPILGLNLF